MIYDRYSRVEFDVYTYLVDAFVPVILLKLLDLPVRVRKPSRDVAPTVSDVRFNDKHIVEREFLLACA